MPTEAETSRARELLDKLGETRWYPDHDWRDDGADQVLDGDDRTVCFLATGMSHARHYARCVFIAAAPELVRALLQRVETLETALRKARAALEDTAAQASLSARHTALTSWPHQLEWLLAEVRREANAGIEVCDAALADDEAKHAD